MKRGSAGPSHEAEWLPGPLASSHSVHEDGDLVVVMDTAELYPDGVIVRYTARRRQEDDVTQTEMVRQIGAVHHGWDHEGPHLLYWPGRSPDDSGHGSPPGDDAWEAFPNAHRGGGRVWRLGFWLPVPGMDRQGLECVLVWPAAGVHLRSGWNGEELASAAERMRELWRRVPA